MARGLIAWAPPSPLLALTLSRAPLSPGRLLSKRRRQGSGAAAPLSYTGSTPASSSSSLYWKGMESSGDPHPPILAGKP